MRAAGVDGDPLAGPGLAQGLKRSGHLGSLQLGDLVEQVGDRPGAVICGPQLRERAVVDGRGAGRDAVGENAKLKRIVADQALDIQGLKELSAGNF